MIREQVFETQGDLFALPQGTAVDRKRSAANCTAPMYRECKGWQTRVATTEVLYHDQLWNTYHDRIHDNTLKSTWLFWMAQLKAFG